MLQKLRDIIQDFHRKSPEIVSAAYQSFGIKQAFYAFPHTEDVGTCFCIDVRVYSPREKSFRHGRRKAVPETEEKS